MHLPAALFLFLSPLPVLLLLPSSCSGARILALLPYNARSHWVVMEPLLLELAHRGHELTVVSSFPQKQPRANYRDIDFSGVFPAAISNYSVEAIKQKMPTPFHTAVFITELHMHNCDTIIRDQRVLRLLDEQFDLVMTEVFGSDCLNFLAARLGAPVVAWVTSAALPWVADRVGLPDNPSYVPSYFVDFSPQMTFAQRAVNALTMVYAKAVYYWLSELPSARLAEEVLGEPLPSMDQVNRQHTALLLVNSHYSLAQSRPFPPNVIEVGGIHIRPPKPLPKDLQDVLASAGDAGVIVFSFGSLVRASSLPRSTLAMFLEAFASLPQKVLMKYEDRLENAPPNVVARKWLPQQDLTGHPSVRAVISHCGLASTVEAVHFAKPLVAVPFYSDQFGNAQSVARRGAGVVLDADRLSVRAISEAIRAVLHDPSYKENMARLSAQFRDRPLGPLQSAVFWTEYVIRHKGAPHLRPASVQMPLYSLLLLDVLALLIAPFLVLYFLIASCCFRSHSTTSRSKKTD